MLVLFIFSGVGYHLAHCLDLTLHGHLMYWIEKIHTEDVIYFTNITQRLQTGTSDLNIMYSTTQDLYDVLIVDPAQRRNGKQLFKTKSLELDNIKNNSKIITINSKQTLHNL